ncbi:uncharacterized protein LOC126679170 [Mercurialis annua]|uniref:uncharacterized protein LOC126679170 n=1 Tax=Mercurialis annua TaxID=3986 RepID=UPI00215FBB01|nr:uncharacterized protein LOC126679170 [Mercurialis annua]
MGNCSLKGVALAAEFPDRSDTGEALVGPAMEVLRSKQSDGVWKVKLVISSKQLEEILSEQGNTEALIEKMRMAAASSATIAPRKSKSSWGVPWKHSILSNVFKVSPIDHQNPDS